MHFKARILSLLLAVWGCCTAWAGSEPGFPFRFENGLIWVAVSSGSSTLNFVLDSGAGSTVLSSQAACRLGLPLGTPIPIRTVAGTTTGYRLKHFSAAVGGIALQREVCVMDLDAADKACGKRIDGLIGQDFFRGRTVQIDFKTHRISLLNDFAGTCDSITLPMRRLNDALCIPVGVNGNKPAWMRLDTGCQSALEWTPSGRTGGLLKAPSVGLSGPANGAIRTELSLGKEQIASVPTGIHPQPMFSGEAGLLGNGVLSKYRVTMNARSMTLILERQ